jgi:hypothetical protein
MGVWRGWLEDGIREGLDVFLGGGWMMRDGFS